ncbi:MAG: N-6 DNA methylase [Paludibacteraceae bacterium]|nr:N-6 DNA methylase [Paludibacteraceae bacterium]
MQKEEKFVYVKKKLYLCTRFMKAKNKYGQYFTEEVIADFMTSLISHPKKSTVLEPSCGKGVFLKTLSEHGFDQVSAYEIDTNLAREYSCIRYESFISSPLSEKFDIIIGNPPYVRWKNLEEELKTELQGNTLWNKYFNSLCDYLFIFILKSIEQLNDQGELIFICSDYWMNTTHSRSLRNYMCSHGYFESIYHFKEAPLFEKVTASFVIFKYIKSAQREKTIHLYSYNKKGKPQKQELLDGTCFDVLEIPQFEPNRRWLLATEHSLQALNAFESACQKQCDLYGTTDLHRLGDVCDIGNGMVSGLDAAFKVNKEEISTFNEEEMQCLINVLKAKNLEQFAYSTTEQYIYIQPNLTREEFERLYPNFVVHFSPFITDLNKRYNYGKNLHYWEFAFPRSKALFERKSPKIFIPCKERISHKKYFRFCYSPAGYYPLQDVTGIVRKTNCRESVEYILAYLNNERVFNWLRYNGIVKGEIVEFSEAPIANIPFLRINWNNVQEVLIHEQITHETYQLLQDNNKIHQEKINELFNILFYEKSRLSCHSFPDDRCYS